MTRFFVRNMINNADPKEGVKHSFNNYHVEGMKYLNLVRSERFTAKIYLLDPLLIKSTQDGFLVNPHDHRYNFGTTVLFGAVSNLVFHEIGQGSGWNHFGYQADTKEFTPQGEVGLQVVEDMTYAVGETYYTGIDDIHTLRLSNELTALLLFQYNDIVLDGTNFYGRDVESPSSCTTGNLYQRFTEDEYAYWLKFILRNVEVVI